MGMNIWTLQLHEKTKQNLKKKQEELDMGMHVGHTHGSRV